MPKIPVPENLGARPIPTPQTGVATYNPRTGSEELAGATGARFGEMVGEFARKEQDRLDLQMAEDAFNQVRNAATELTVGKDGFVNIKGADAVKKPFVDQYSTKLNDVSAEIEKQFTNENQRALYKQRFGIASWQFNENLLRHRVQEGNAYAEQVFEGVTSSELRSIGTQFLDPNAVNLSILRMQKGVDEIAGKRGLDDAKKNELKAKLTDAAMSTRFESWMYSDPVGAYKAFRENADKITNPDVRLNLERKLKTAAIPLEVRSAAATVMGANGEADLQRAVSQPPNTENLVAAVVQQESGGRQSAVSPKGAVGVMQVMPETGRQVATSLGIPYDEQRLRTDEGYNRQIGTAYLNQMLAKYNGNQTLALAAYNAGPARVDEWIGTIGDPRTSAITDAEFAQRIPFAETRNYVSSINAKAAPTNSVDTRAMLSTWISNAEKEAQRTHPNDPIYRDALLNEVKAKYNLIVQQQQGLERQAHSVLVAAGMPDPQGRAPTTIAELTSTPERARAWQIVSANGDSAKGIFAMLDHNARNADRADPKIMSELFLRIHAPDGDPNKITSVQQLVPFFDRTGRTGYDWLKKTLDEQGSAGGKSWSADVEMVRRKGEAMITRSILGSVQPDVAEEAAYRFTIDMRKKIDEYQKAFQAGDKTKDPRLLLTPGTKDYLLDPAKVATYMTPPDQAVAAEAAKVIAAGQAQGTLPPTDQMAKLDPKDPQKAYEALAPGAWFVAPDGRVGRKRGAEPTQEYGNRADGTPKGMGYFGELKRPDGKVSTELSVTSSDVKDKDGKEIEFPLLVPSLTRKEVDHLLSDGKPTDAIMGKAIAHAKERMAAGKSPFAGAGEQMAPPGGKDTGPKVPELVDEPTGRRGAKPDREKVRAQFQAMGSDYLSAMTAPLRLRAAAQGAVIRALTPDDALRSTKAFREIVKTGKYTVASEQVIGDAIASGLLSDQEKAMAQTMLETIDKKKQR